MTTNPICELIYCVTMRNGRDGFSCFEASGIEELQEQIIEYYYDRARASGDYTQPEVKAFWVEYDSGLFCKLSADKFNEDLEHKWPLVDEPSDYAEHSTHFGLPAQAWR